MSKFQFRADHFLAVSKLTSKEETRYYLTGVHIEPDPAGGIFLVATDGHRLCVAHDPNGYAERNAILTCDFKSPALKSKRNENFPRHVYLDGGSADVRLVETVALATNADAHPLVDRLLFDEIDGTFPDWRRVVPMDVEPSHMAPLSFNVNLLRDIADSAKVLATDRCLAMELFQKSPGDPMVLRFGQLPDVVYVLMPMRGAGLTSTPDWLRGGVAEKTTEAA